MPLIQFWLVCGPSKQEDRILDLTFYYVAGIDMDAAKAKKIFEEAEVKQVEGGFCIVSSAGLFEQAKNIVQEAYKTASYLGILFTEIMDCDAFRLKIIDINSRKRIEAFVTLNDAWTHHARNFLGSTFGEFGSISRSNESLFSEYFSAVVGIKHARAASNVIEFPSASKNKAQDVERYFDVKRFLRISGYEILPNDVLSRADAEALILNTKQFINDAYENAKIAKMVSHDLLNAEGGVHALIGEQTLDNLSIVSAKNEAWMLITDRSFFSQGEHLQRNAEIEEDFIEEVASMSDNVQRAPFGKDFPKTSRFKPRRTPVEIHRL